MEDIWKNIDPSQFCGEKGTGVEHMIVKLLDRIHSLLDENPDKSAVLAVGIDWHSAFDRVDPTKCVSKFIKLGLRPSLVPVLIDYLTDRTMSVKFNGEVSPVFNLTGQGQQGSQLGQVAYTVSNSDAANGPDLLTDEPRFNINNDDRYKYCDDLSILELLSLAGIVTEYNVLWHVPSDVSVSQKFIPPEMTNTSVALQQITDWTNDNLMLLNPLKSNYMFFS